MTSRIFTYRIDERHLPKGASARIEWALTQWQKQSGGRVRFHPDRKKPNIMFSGAKPPPNEKNLLDPFEAYYFDLGHGVFSIIFDPAVKWATTWLQRRLPWFHDFDTLLLHEIGHVLLGPDHSNDPESIMYYRPQSAKIDQASLNTLQA